MGCCRNGKASLVLDVAKALWVTFILTRRNKYGPIATGGKDANSVFDRNTSTVGIIYEKNIDSKSSSTLYILALVQFQNRYKQYGIFLFGNKVRHESVDMFFD